MTLNGHDIHKGVNINDSLYPFTDWILSGDKDIETRNTKSLDSVLGQRIAIIRTGCGKAMIVGTAYVDYRVDYDNEPAFRHDEDRHLVAPDTAYDISKSPTLCKYGYRLFDVEALPTPIPCTSRGIVIRNI